MTLHQLLGHPSEEITRATGLKLRLQMKGAMNRCEGCGRFGHQFNQVQEHRWNQVLGFIHG